MFIGVIVLGVVVGIIIAVVIAVKQTATAEKVDCPTCGRTTLLPGGSAKCPKCKTLIVRTSSGELITK